MKVKVTIELDIPVLSAKESLHEIVNGAFVTYAETAHSRDAMKWVIKANQNPDDLAAKQLVSYHETWQEILSKAEVVVESI